MAWRIEFDPSAEKEIKKLGRQPAQRIIKFCLSGCQNLTIHAVLAKP
jgi:mRNA-degrading endonuclease RelE of RelBE toxin-antitoxin system